MKKFMRNTRYLILNALIFAIPFFFLGFTQEYFITNKLYLLGFGVLLLILISTIQILISKKISWQKFAFDNLILLFLTAMAISIIFSSHNKIQALLNPNFGLVMMVSLAILYFYLSRSQSDVRVGSSDPKKGGITPPLQSIIYHLSSIILSLITIVFFFQPLKNINLPQFLAFLKNPLFTPVGSQLDLAIILGFFVIFAINRLLTMKQSIFNYSLLTINLLALFLTVYSLVKPIQLVQPIQLTLPPFRLSWFAALETLKTPKTALIGAGLDNFSAIFTKVKDFAYNQSPLWQINAFNVSRSAILQILTETGIFGLLSFGLLIFSVFKLAMKQWNNGTMKPLIGLFLYLLICLFLFPSSLIIWFLFFLALSQINIKVGLTNSTDLTDLTDLLPIYLGIIIVSFLLVGASVYFLGRSYTAEIYFERSITGKNTYEDMRQAIIFNKYIERYHLLFSQINLKLADNVFRKIQSQAEQKKTDDKVLEQDRQTIAQAIQAAIAEGKVVVSLNPQKADGWQNLASIYLNVINTAQDADVWAISAYQRAIVSDPQNPTYRVGLGGVYYSLKKYDDAARFFEQAVSLKPDWPNASYNYAWANFQKENYPQAVNAMQNTLSLLNQKSNKADYEKIQKELADFKKMLPKEEEATKPSESESESGTLNLPTPPQTQISPKLELPKETSPEAK